MKPRLLTAGTAAVALLITLVIGLVPSFGTSYRSLPTHIALETAEGVAGLIVMVLVYGRFVLGGLTRDLLVAYALGLLASANLFLSVVPAAATGGRDTIIGSWGPAAVRLTGAVALTVGAVFDSATIHRRRRAGVIAFLFVLFVVAASGISVGALDDVLPEAVDVATGTHHEPSLTPHPVVRGVQVVTGLLFAAAALGFTRRSEKDGDELFGWLAAGAVLSAVARINYVLVPSLYSDFVHAGDFFRLGSYAFYLIGGVREVTRYWRSVGAAAVADDRRRMARDLHDGLAQELSFIARQARVLAARPDPEPALQPLIAAAERALDESRAAIHALTREADEPLDVVLSEAAGEVAGRLDATLHLDLDRDVSVDLPVQEALARVVREAVSNAVRHGAASTITVRLASGPPITVIIDDDGRGFDADAPVRPGALGLVSMRERLAALGGTVEIRSTVGGTTVEVTLP